MNEGVKVNAKNKKVLKYINDEVITKGTKYKPGIIWIGILQIP